MTQIQSLIYRQKVLLALVGYFGGSLSKTDCQKLMFGFCQYSEESFYDFFPHKYGGYSHTLSYDKQRLTILGFFSSESRFMKMPKGGGFFGSISKKDQLALTRIKEDTKGLRGRKLLRKFYLEYPYFAHRSEVLNTVLQGAEVSKVKKEKPKNEEPGLFTLGYEGISIDAYLNKLIANNIKAVFDIRKNPYSRKFGFSKEALKSFLNTIGVYYFHFPELGVPSSLRKNLGSTRSYESLFEYYSKTILKENQTSLDQIKALAKHHKRIALTCFESDHLFCHRHLVSNYLESPAGLRLATNHLH
jgi:uncharacterized protein (DUF488 family)